MHLNQVKVLPFFFFFLNSRVNGGLLFNSISRFLLPHRGLFWQAGGIPDVDGAEERLLF